MNNPTPFLAAANAVLSSYAESEAVAESMHAPLFGEPYFTCCQLYGLADIARLYGYEEEARAISEAIKCWCATGKKPQSFELQEIDNEQSNSQ